MPDRAHVASLEALETFRANLVVYVSQARPALEEVSAEVLRTRLWLEDEKRNYWEKEVRRRTKELEQAQQALFGSRLGLLKKESAAEQMAVHRAKRALEEAESKLRILKKWRRDFDGRVQPLVKQMEKLHTVLSHDMTQAVAYLNQTLDTLASYAEIHVPGGGPAAPSSSGSAPVAGAGASLAAEGAESKG
jgi:predicted ATPase